MEANMFQVNQRHRRRTLRENLIVSVPLPSFLLLCCAAAAAAAAFAFVGVMNRIGEGGRIIAPNYKGVGLRARL